MKPSVLLLTRLPETLNARLRARFDCHVLTGSCGVVTGPPGVIR